MRGGRLSRLGKALDQLSQGDELKQAVLTSRAIALWPVLVGPQIARVSRPERLERGVLSVVTRDGAWSAEIMMQKQLILEEFKRRVGRGIVRDIRCRVDSALPAAPPPDFSAGVSPEAYVTPSLAPAETERIDAVVRHLPPELADGVRRAMEADLLRQKKLLQAGGALCAACGAALPAGCRVCAACTAVDTLEPPRYSPIVEGPDAANQP